MHVDGNYELCCDKHSHSLIDYELPKILIKIKDKYYIALIDSGAMINTIFKNTTDQCELQEYIDQTNNIILKGVNDTYYANGKIWSLALFIDNLVIYDSFIVMNNINRDDIDIILGLPFLHGNKVIIDFNGQYLYIKGYIIKFI